MVERFCPGICVCSCARARKTIAYVSYRSDAFVVSVTAGIPIDRTVSRMIEK